MRQILSKGQKFVWKVWNLCERCEICVKGKHLSKIQIIFIIILTIIILLYSMP